MPFSVIVAFVFVLTWLNGSALSYSKSTSRELVDRLRAATGAKWLIVHDADDDAPWIHLGFQRVPPPDDITDPVLVFVSGLSPKPVLDILATRGFQWSLDAHRYSNKNDEDES